MSTVEVCEDVSLQHIGTFYSNGLKECRHAVDRILIADAAPALNSPYIAYCIWDSGDIPQNHHRVTAEVRYIGDKYIIALAVEGVPLSERHTDFLEKGLSETLPTADLLGKLSATFIEYYHELSILVSEGTFNVRTYRTLLEKIEHSLPQIRIENGTPWLSSFLLGIAMKNARIAIMNEHYAAGGDMTGYFELEKQLIQSLIKENDYIHNRMSDSMLLGISLPAIHRWSWRLMNRYSESFLFNSNSVHIKRRTEWFNSMMTLHDAFLGRVGLRTENDIVAVMGLPAGGKSEFLLQMALLFNGEGIPEIWADIERPKTTGHAQAKADIRRSLRAIRSQTDGAIWQSSFWHIYAGLASSDEPPPFYCEEYPSAVRHLYERLHEYLLYTQAAALRIWNLIIQNLEVEDSILRKGKKRFLLQTFLEVPFVITVAQQYGAEINALIRERYPDLMEELRSHDVVNIPDDLRIMIERLLFTFPLSSQLFHTFVHYPLSGMYLLDTPADTCRERIREEIEERGTSLREPYVPYLELMRLVNLTLAHLFPHYIQIVSAESHGGTDQMSSRYSLSPMQIAWRARRDDSFITLASLAERGEFGTLDLYLEHLADLLEVVGDVITNPQHAAEPSYKELIDLPDPYQTL